MKLQVEKAIYGGAGLARFPKDASPSSSEGSSLEGKAVFVPYTLPGEVVEAHLSESRRGFSTAKVDAVLEPSPERIPPGCEYFPACGGCQYQHANASYQLQMKLDILRDTLARTGLRSELSSLGTISSSRGPEWGYRNRIRLHLVRIQGSLQLCYRGRGSHTSLPIAHCPIAAPLLQRAIRAAQKAGNATELEAYCQEIEFFTNAEEDALLVSLWKPTKTSHSAQSALPAARVLDDFCRHLHDEIPELVGAGIFEERDGKSRLTQHWGQTSLFYTVEGCGYRISLGSFFQVNRFLIPNLMGAVLNHGIGEKRSGRLAWDLYAGAGLFALALDFEEVVAVESAPFSVADLRKNLSGTPRRAVQSSTLDFLREQNRKRSGPRPDLIVVDPPRAGLGKEVCTHLSQVGAPELVYVSCDPATLARDLQALLQFGYRLQSMHMLDLFPQTYHLETVTVLGRLQGA